VCPSCVHGCRSKTIALSINACKDETAHHRVHASQYHTIACEGSKREAQSAEGNICTGIEGTGTTTGAREAKMAIPRWSGIYRILQIRDIECAVYGHARKDLAAEKARSQY
jgi:hypothetical protein